jgi:bacterioferritin-associated ferredoxin
MIVCSCHVFSDHDVQAAVSAAAAAPTVSQVYRQLGHTPHCGRCAHTIRNALRNDRSEPAP